MVDLGPIYRHPWRAIREDGRPFQLIAPCPFCGHEALHFITRPRRDRGDDMSRICRDCGSDWGEW